MDDIGIRFHSFVWQSFEEMMRPTMSKVVILAFVLVAGVAEALTFKTKNSSEHDDVQRRTPVQMQPSPIDSVTLPNEWPFKPSNKLSLINRQHLSDELQDDFFLSGGQADRCGEIGTSGPSPEQLASCIETVALEFYRSGSMAHFEPTLVNIAKTDPLTYVTKASDFSPDRYNARAAMTVYGAFYAYYYDFFSFDAETRQLVDSYFERKLTYLNMDAVGEYKNQRFCDPRKPKRIGLKTDGRADLNTCESNRWKATIAQLLLGMRLKNETLFQRGIYNTKFMLLLFDDEGIFIPWAVRGALAIHYSNEVPRFLSKLTEIYHALGYDFLEHELETGLRVKDLYKTYFNIYDNKDILNKYAKRRYAEKGENYAQYQKRSTEEELRRWNLTKESFARESMRYITSYRPDLESLIACDFHVRLPNGEPQRLVSSFSAVDSYEFHLANIPDNQAPEEHCQKMRSEKNHTEINRPVDAASGVQGEADNKKAAEPKIDGDSAHDTGAPVDPFRFEFAEDGEPFSLGEDIGFGLNYSHQMGQTFQEWGATVSTDIVRLGDKALKFETREGFCGYGSSWSDCDNGRQRHEFGSRYSDSQKAFNLNKDYWHAISVYVPRGIRFAKPVNTGIFQFFAPPTGAWMFHYSDTMGFKVVNSSHGPDHDEDHRDSVLVLPEDFVGKWNDIVIQANHSRDPDGYMKIWVNGDLVHDYKGISTRPSGTPFFKFGIYNTATPIPNPDYNNGANFEDMHVFYDEIRFAESCKDLALDDLGYSCEKLLQSGAYGPNDQVFEVSYLVKFNGKKDTELEARDIVVFPDARVAQDKTGITPNIQFGHVTEDSIESEREKLDVRLTEDGMLSISGQMQVFRGEPLIRVRLEAVAPNGEMEIPYVAGDKVFIRWTSISDAGTDSEQEFAVKDAKPKYDRTRAGLSMRFECLLTALSDNGEESLPTDQEVDLVIDGLEGNKFYRTKRHLEKLGMSKDAVKAHKAALLRLVNFEGTNEAFCAKPVR